MRRLGVLLALVAACAGARADALAALKAFVRDTGSGRAEFTQTVTSPDGKRVKTSSGSFEFLRPNRFRFAYAKPFEQLIVADGSKVWIYDPDLNQASSRKLSQALGATPAALLAGGSLERDFELAPAPDRLGLAWVEATPRQPDSALERVRIGFRGAVLAAVEIVDSFGQTSLLQFSRFAANVPLAAESFRFVAPAGTELIEQ